MKKFENPVIDVETIAIVDVITTSTECLTECAANTCTVETPEI